MTFDIDLARRFDGVPMAPGMRRCSGEHPSEWWTCVAAAEEGEGALWCSEEGDAYDENEAPASFSLSALDYTDPGTLGHILAAVRAAWGDEFAANFGTQYAGWDVCVVNDGLREFYGDTEAHALAAAWEGRPR